ncbi:MAG: hypothetical protein F4149_17810 [Gammaproteobacteria bacterium]|nr:hypothetical protein [Gammaproteobacteria bacterium]MYK83604.1 hypothetical protein [Gammaproteobacteria bacterium]
MVSEQCPVCQGAAQPCGTSDFGERRRVSCFRCGRFEITGTALAMLSRRLQNVKNGVARLSHALRSRQTVGENWVSVDSVNIDALLETPLPNIAAQLDNLVRWTAANLGDNQLGTVALPPLDNLAGVVGTIDGEHVKRLLDHAGDKRLIDFSHGKGILLTPAGWDRAQSSEHRKQEGNAIESAATGSSESQSERVGSIVTANCNQCGGERRSFVRGSHKVDDNDGDVSWGVTMEILECRGCGELSARRRAWFSEWENVVEDPATGRLVRQMPEKVDCWPARRARARPAWQDRLPDENLRQVMEEVYVAIDHDLAVLAAIGTRTLLDRAMTLKVGDQHGGFRGKLDAMVAEGHMGEHEKGKFLVIVDVGSAAAHRGHVPDASALNGVLTAVEALLYRLFVEPKEVQAMDASTPRRSS